MTCSDLILSNLNWEGDLEGSRTDSSLGGGAGGIRGLPGFWHEMLGGYRSCLVKWGQW